MLCNLQSGAIRLRSVARRDNITLKARRRYFCGGLLGNSERMEGYQLGCNLKAAG